MTVVLASALVLLLYSYIGTFVFGVFIYYAARPLYRRLRPAVGRPGVAAAGALFAFEIPFLAVSAYLLFLALRELDRYAGTGADLIARFLPVPPAEVEQAIADPGAYVSASRVEHGRRGGHDGGNDIRTDGDVPHPFRACCRVGILSTPGR
ncbi:MAG: hypothetical protein U5J98_01405 [Halobacteriales archaeon]|nr:hypothetical protein [Halobacteriales archaeon]